MMWFNLPGSFNFWRTWVFSVEIMFLQRYIFYKHIHHMAVNPDILLSYADHPNCRQNTTEEVTFWMLKLQTFNIKGLIETSPLPYHQTLMYAFLLGSDSNISHKLNLSSSCLNTSLRLGQSAQCWQDSCHCWHLSKPHLD